jgi:hypothetical protein
MMVFCAFARFINCSWYGRGLKSSCLSSFSIYNRSYYQNTVLPYQWQHIQKCLHCETKCTTMQHCSSVHNHATLCSIVKFCNSVQLNKKWKSDKNTVMQHCLAHNSVFSLLCSSVTVGIPVILVATWSQPVHLEHGARTEKVCGQNKTIPIIHIQNGSTCSRERSLKWHCFFQMAAHNYDNPNHNTL